jgi:hypothetical protein
VSESAPDADSIKSDDVGPVEYLVVEFPSGTTSTAGFVTRTASRSHPGGHHERRGWRPADARSRA